MASSISMRRSTVPRNRDRPPVPVPKVTPSSRRGSPIEYRPLGKSDLRVSSFGMGCGNFGGVGSASEFFGMGESEDAAFRLLDRAVEIGINFFDTADSYGGGRSETTIGNWLQTKSPSLRDRLLISSKVGNPVGQALESSGLSRGHIMQQVDASLTRLGIDHLDMYLIHEPDPDTTFEETMDAFDEVVRSGKVRHIGVSNLSPSAVTRFRSISAANHLHQFRWVQDSFNLIDQEDQTDLLALCRDQGLGFTPYSPLCGGLLTGKYQLQREYPAGSRMTLRPEPYLRFWNEKTFSRIDRLAGRASDLNVSTAGLALGWLHNHADVSASIVGPRRIEHFEPVEEALAIELSVSEWDDIGRLFRTREGG
jgi:1-deoxyxylulose-5-phosphate synthase